MFLTALIFKVFQYCLLALSSSHHLSRSLQPVWDVKENSRSAVCLHLRQMSKKWQMMQAFSIGAGLAGVASCCQKYSLHRHTQRTRDHF